MAELKDLFYLGLGSALITKEKIEAEVKDLLEKAKLTKEQQAEFMEKAKEKAKAEEKEFNEKLKSLIKEVLSDMGIATKEDIEELKKLITK